jgi:mannose-1-phosphate guanylyltransferase
MAGGVGSRFWPASKTSLPKQFLDILGTGETLIQQTYKRFSKFCKPENFIVVTNQLYKDLVAEQIPDLKEDQILLEPVMRNTAPCIAYAAYKIAATEKEANLIITPADHLILKQPEFESVVEFALDHTSKNDHLVTLGIQPTRPDTGYGYIEYEQSDKSIHPVVQFREKPDIQTAKSFITQGNFSWNSGMFFWSLATILNAFEDFLPEVNSLFSQGINKYNTEAEAEFIEDVYPKCESISIDFGIMEKASNVHMINADIGWSDLGTWGSVYTHLDQDVNGNSIDSQKVVLNNVSNTLVKLPEGKVAIIQGLDGYIVVDTPQGLLISKMEDEQKIKQLRIDLGDKFGKEYI